MASQQHVCFYSNKCDWSRAFIEELATTPWKNEFRFICVDPSPQRPQLPKWLKKVPTLVIKGESEPREDSQVMNWLYERKQKDLPNQSQQPQGASGGMAASDVEGFLQSEMGKAVGYQYSFVDSDTSLGGNGGTSIPGNFEFLGGAAAPGDRATQQIGDIRAGASGNSGRSKKELMFDKQMEAYQRERDAALTNQTRRRV